MKVNFDGIRKTTTDQFNRLGDMLEEILDKCDFDISQEEIDEISSQFNNIANMIIGLNCIYDDETKDDINDLSYLDVKRLPISYFNDGE